MVLVLFMQMRNQLRKNNNNSKKGQVLLFGSFLIFIGFISIFWNYFLKMRDEVYSDMKIAMMNTIPTEIVESSEQDKKENVIAEKVAMPENVSKQEEAKTYVVDYSKYLAVLEIPKIGLKRGFYNVDSKYNNIEYNVTMVKGSSLPNVENGNLILMAHSGDAYISYFAYLYRLNVGDMAYVTYLGKRYGYQIVNIYRVEKNGVVVIQRNDSRTTLTMITCTKDDDFTQTVYIAELVE